MRLVRVTRVGLNGVAKMEARKTEPVDISASISAIRSANACGEVFCFLGVHSGVVGDEGGGLGSNTVFYAKTSLKFQAKRLIAHFERSRSLPVGSGLTDRLWNTAAGNSKMAIFPLVL